MPCEDWETLCSKSPPRISTGHVARIQARIHHPPEIIRRMRPVGFVKPVLVILLCVITNAVGDMHGFYKLSLMSTVHHRCSAVVGNFPLGSRQPVSCSDRVSQIAQIAFCFALNRYRSGFSCRVSEKHKPPGGQLSYNMGRYSPGTQACMC